MIPGTVSKLSRSAVTAAATIGPVNSDLVYVTGSTTIATIKPPNNGGFSGLLFVVADEAVATTTSGNIAAAVTLGAALVTVFVYDDVTGTWHPGAIS